MPLLSTIFRKRRTASWMDSFSLTCNFTMVSPGHSLLYQRPCNRLNLLRLAGRPNQKMRGFAYRSPVKLRIVVASPSLCPDNQSDLTTFIVLSCPQESPVLPSKSVFSIDSSRLGAFPNRSNQHNRSPIRAAQPA